MIAVTGLCLTYGLVASPAWAMQDGGGVVVEMAPDSGQAEANPQASADQMASDFLAEKKWTEGPNDGGRFYVVKSAAGFAAPPGSPDWYITRSNAFQLAMLNARKQMAEYLSAAVSTLVSSAYQETTVSQTISNPSGVIGSGNAASGVAAQAVGAVNAELANAGVNATTDPSAASQAAARLVSSSTFSSAVNVMARAEVAGLQAFRTFEGKGGPNGEVVVISVFSDKGMELRDALLGLNPPPTKAPGPRIGDWAREVGPETLLFSFGTQTRTNENGELVLVAFGQANPSASNARAVDAARSKAMSEARKALRQYMGELVETTSDMMQSENLAEYADKTQVYDNDSAFNERIQAAADTLDMNGAISAHNWTARHPLLDTDTAGVVLVISVSEALKANGTRERLAKVAASRGGRGMSDKMPRDPAASPPPQSKPTPRAPASGGGAAGEDP